jgi:hypothetical protein
VIIIVLSYFFNNIEYIKKSPVNPVTFFYFPYAPIIISLIIEYWILNLIYWPDMHFCLVKKTQTMILGYPFSFVSAPTLGLQTEWHQSSKVMVSIFCLTRDLSRSISNKNAWLDHLSIFDKKNEIALRRHIAYFQTIKPCSNTNSPSRQ